METKIESIFFMTELSKQEIKELEHLDNYASFRSVWWDLKFGKHWESLSFIKIEESFKLGLIIGVKQNEDSKLLEDFYILPASEKEEWSLERYSKLFEVINNTKDATTFKRLTMAIVNGDSTIVYYHLYPGIHNSNSD